MMNLQYIEKKLDEGAFEDAEQGIEDLLVLGPKNIAALKLKAQIFEHMGFFRKADQVWQQIGIIDSEDEEAYDYINFIIGGVSRV